MLAVANCHLHFDHAGGNARFPGIPIVVQRVEHETALATEDYTLPGIADFPGARYELLDGEAPIWPGLTVIPTPGHTAGHQSLVVETRQGRVVLAGQSFNLASEYAQARLSRSSSTPATAVMSGIRPGWMSSKPSIHGGSCSHTTSRRGNVARASRVGPDAPRSSAPAAASGLLDRRATSR